MIAEEIAEMLSTDMQKEGICGRTLTLKLKTAAFEVCDILFRQVAINFTVVILMLYILTIICNLQLRTRAMTLQKHISSSKDILKHASKLLKAELPISLRLIGGHVHGLLFTCVFA